MFNEPSYTPGTKGKTSSARVISIVIIFGAMLMSIAIVIVGILISLTSDKLDATALLLSASASGTLFITMGGPAMFFLFKQKRGEVQAMTEALKATNENEGAHITAAYNPTNATYQS